MSLDIIWSNGFGHTADVSWGNRRKATEVIRRHSNNKECKILTIHFVSSPKGQKEGFTSMVDAICRSS